MMADIENIWNNDDFFADRVDTPKEGVEQHGKQERLKGAINSSIKQRHKKATNKIINKTYAEYKQRELNWKGEKMGRALGKHAISLYSTGLFDWLKWGM